MRRLIALALLMAALPALAEPNAMTQKPPARPLPLARVFASPALSGSVPRLLTIAPDGRHLAWLKPRADDLQRYDLWLRDTETGAERMLIDSEALSPAPAALSEAELMRRERARLGGSRGIIDYGWAPDGKSLLVPLDGDIWLAPLEAAPRRLTNTPETELDAKLSRTGRYLSMVRNQNIHVLDLQTGESRALTRDGGGTVAHGLAEFIAQEEMGRTTGSWWSPDDTWIAVTRTEEAGVAIAVRAAIGATTKVTEQRYPFAGTPNARISLALHDPEAKRPPISIDLGADPDIYLARVKWLSPNRLVIITQPRDQSRLDLLDVDLQTGATRPILSTPSKTWVDLHDSLAAIPGSTDLLWLSEHNGHRHLYRAAGDRLQPITRGDWSADELLAVGEDGQLLFTGFADSPLEKALYTVALDGRSAPVRLSLPGHWAEAVADKSGRKALVTSSAPDQPPRIDLLDTASRTSTAIAAPTLADIPYAPYAADHVVPRFGTLKAADGITDLHYSLLLPTSLKAGQKAPVFFEVYGGPGHQQVRKIWGPMIHQWLVRQGWIVFTLDNRGTPNRGTAFRDAIHKGLGTVEVDDQIAGLNWLKTQLFVDPARVAVYGWSYGGYMVLRLMTKHPQAFAIGIAGAPVTDWTLYDTHYTERYLGNPATDKAPYTASDVTPDAAALARPLLIVHGLADDNVIFDHSARMIAALQQAGRPFRVMPYPGATHSIADPALRTHVWETISETLAPIAP
jgi:dipeptidyl-peptidase-4